MDELAVDGVEPAEHQRQHVVEVVRDAAGELAERLHLLRLSQLLLEPPPFAHVAGADDDPPRPSLAARDRGRDRFDDLAVLRAFVAIGTAVAQSGRKMAVDLGGLFRSQNLVGRAPDHLRRASCRRAGALPD